MVVSFNQMKNIDSLFDMLDKCIGAIFITISNCDKVDIRKNPLIRKLLKSACQKQGIEKLNVTVENNQDMSRIFSYLFSSNCNLRQT